MNSDDIDLFQHHFNDYNKKRKIINKNTEKKNNNFSFLSNKILVLLNLILKYFILKFNKKNL